MQVWRTGLDGGPAKQLTTLPAVRTNRVAVIDAPEAYVSGPRILTLMDRVSAELRRFAAAP